MLLPGIALQAVSEYIILILKTILKWSNGEEAGYNSVVTSVLIVH